MGQRSLCCGFLCLLCVSGPIILRRSLYRATANYDMGYPLYCENELPVTLLILKLVLFGGRALQIFYAGGTAPFGGPSYFPPKVRLLVLPLRASNSMSSLIPFSHAHAHTLRFQNQVDIIIVLLMKAMPMGYRQQAVQINLRIRWSPIVFCMGSRNCFQNSLSQLSGYDCAECSMSQSV